MNSPNMYLKDISSTFITSGEEAVVQPGKFARRNQACLSDGELMSVEDREALDEVDQMVWKPRFLELWEPGMQVMNMKDQRIHLEKSIEMMESSRYSDVGPDQSDQS